MRIFTRQKQMELMKASVRSEENERMRIASELHDDVGATLSSARLFLHQALCNPDDAGLGAQTKKLLDEGIRRLRDLSQQLQPGTLQYLGLINALKTCAATIARDHRISMNTAIDPESWIEPEPQTALAVYRVVQQLLNNIVEHAGASEIQLATTVRDTRRCISIFHNGTGLTETVYRKLLNAKGSTRLKNIEHRLQCSGMSIAFPAPRSGISSVILRLPEHSSNV